MREHKYRGIKVGSEEFVYGYYYKCDWKEHKHYIRVQKDSHFIDIAVIPETVGEYTSTKDKNSKEIYEGDIVEAFRNKKAVVKFGEYSVDGDDYYSNWTTAGFYIKYQNKETSKIEHFETNRIGNIHQNKDLLK